MTDEHSGEPSKCDSAKWMNSFRLFPFFRRFGGYNGSQRSSNFSFASITQSDESNRMGAKQFAWAVHCAVMVRMNNTIQTATMKIDSKILGSNFSANMVSDQFGRRFGNWYQCIMFLWTWQSQIDFLNKQFDVTYRHRTYFYWFIQLMSSEFSDRMWPDYVYLCSAAIFQR